MHHFIIKFSKFASHQAAKGTPLTKILRTFLTDCDFYLNHDLDFDLAAARSVSAKSIWELRVNVVVCLCGML